VKNYPELNIVKRIRICKYLGYCYQILYSSTRRLTDFQCLQNVVTNFIYPHYSLTCWRTALTSCMVSSCVDKQNVTRRRHGFNWSTQSWKRKEKWMNLRDLGNFARVSLPLPNPWRRPLERTTNEEWHTVINASLIELSIRSISDRSDCEGVSVRTFNINFKRWECYHFLGWQQLRCVFQFLSHFVYNLISESE